MSKLYTIKKVFLYVLKICIAIVWIYVTMDLMTERWGGLAIGAYLTFPVVALFFLIDYVFKYHIRK